MISGGSSMFAGFPTRLQLDVNRKFREQNPTNKTMKLQVFDPPRRKFNVFIGATVLANIMKDVPEVWVTKEEYEEHGDAAIEKLASTDI